MRILLTNDDGYQAPGIRALYDALSEVADVTVVAPDRQRSAVSLGITLEDPLRAWSIDHTGMKGFAVNGTPADCVKMGMGELVKETPDFVFSGINQGTNVGLNCNYSGTVAGAVEGALNGIPSIAVSLLSFTQKDYSVPARAARLVLEKLETFQMTPYEVLNVNVPDLPMDKIKGIRVAPVSHALYREVVEKRYDTRHQEYYWMGGRWMDLNHVEGGDHETTSAGYIAVTPLTVDWTSHKTLGRLRDAGWDQDWRSGEAR